MRIRIFSITLLSCIALNASASVILQNTFSGIPKKLLKNVENRLVLHGERYNKKLTAALANYLFASGKKQVKLALQPYGYLRVKVYSKLYKNGDRWLANYNVKLGPQLKITKLTVDVLGDAKRDPAFRKLLVNFPLKLGDGFNAQNYNDAKQKLLRLASNRGYLDAVMQESQIFIDKNRYTCDIKLVFFSGRRYYFGPIYFSKTVFNKGFLRKFLSFDTNQHYVSSKIEDTKQNFNDSGLFKSVDIESKTSAVRNLKLPIMVTLKERASREYQVGAGYGTDTGVRGILGLTLRNFSQYGHQFNSILRASQRQANLSAHYTIPGSNPAEDRYDLSAETEYQRDVAGTNQTYKIGAGYISVVHGWQQTLRLSLHHEWYKIAGQGQHRLSTLLVPSANWIRTVANHELTPTKGYRLGIFFQGAMRGVISNVSFLQTKLHVKTIYPLLSKDRLLLVLRGDIGYTAVNANQSENLPLTMRLFAGGANSVRGYSYQSIGPGNQMLVLSGELRLKVYKKWYLASFYDTGSVNDDLFSTSSTKNTVHFARSAGVGVVWLSPVGTLELTYAKAVDGSHNAGKFQFSMGAEL
ncbi:MAG: BamA/TamA family outer membrane protein [Gammaproteobacteria bacterium]|nr:BamA/TamA family outer membrane protein [Gammaproteobacteria bacterium]